MAYLTEANFDSRSKRILKNARIAKRGRVTVIRDDGLIVARARRSRHQLPLVGLGRIVLALWIFKALAIFNLGASDYDTRITVLQDGNVVDRMLAFVLQADALTLTAVGMMHSTIAALSRMELAAIF